MVFAVCRVFFIDGVIYTSNPDTPRVLDFLLGAVFVPFHYKSPAI